MQKLRTEKAINELGESPKISLGSLLAIDSILERLEECQ